MKQKEQVNVELCSELQGWQATSSVANHVLGERTNVANGTACEDNTLVVEGSRLCDDGRWTVAECAATAVGPTIRQTSWRRTSHDRAHYQRHSRLDRLAINNQLYRRRWTICNTNTTQLYIADLAPRAQQLTLSTCWSWLLSKIWCECLSCPIATEEYTWRAIGPLSENMTSSTRPEVHNVSQLRQRRAEPR